MESKVSFGIEKQDFRSEKSDSRKPKEKTDETTKLHVDVFEPSQEIKFPYSAELSPHNVMVEKITQEFFESLRKREGSDAVNLIKEYAIHSIEKRNGLLIHMMKRNMGSNGLINVCIPKRYGTNFFETSKLFLHYHSEQDVIIYALIDDSQHDRNCEWKQSDNYFVEHPWWNSMHYNYHDNNFIHKDSLSVNIRKEKIYNNRITIELRDAAIFVILVPKTFDIDYYPEDPLSLTLMPVFYDKLMRINKFSDFNRHYIDAIEGERFEKEICSKIQVISNPLMEQPAISYGKHSKQKHRNEKKIYERKVKVKAIEKNIL